MTDLRWTKVLELTIVGALVVGCSDSGGSDDNVDTGDQATRVQDTREFAVQEETLAFEAIDGVETDRWTGVMDNGAGYRVEVPAEGNWNGMLVMYAHGYRGEGSELTVSSPALRSYYISRGYAWAASSYSTNYYDVRTGVEDTNALANAFVDIAAQNGRTLMAPSKIYITGDSMGGHVTAAAIEAETQATAANKVTYAGAVPRCGVVGGTYEFDYLLNFTFAAQHVADMGPTSYPATDFDQAAIDDVLMGCANQAGEDNRNVARMSALLAGLPDAVPGATINRLCGSGMDATAMAARMIKTGEADLIIAGGVESMSRAPFVMAKSDKAFARTPEVYDTTIGWRFTNPALSKLHHPYAMGETAENVARHYKITREEQDRFAVLSQQRWALANEMDTFKDELITVEVPQRRGDPVLITTDEHPRPDTTIEKLAKLKPAFAKDDAGTAQGGHEGRARGRKAKYSSVAD